MNEPPSSPRIATAEMGKPITESVAEVEKCAWVCEYYAEMSPNALADEDVEASGSRSWIRHEPLGTVLAIMPWNFPYWQVFRFAAPTLMAGNAGILKHSPNVTGVALAIESVFRDAGLPDEVFRTLVVAEPDVPATVDGLIHDDRIAAVTLTGSNRAGSHVAASAGQAAKKSVLELGGSDPFVVLDDADLDAVVPKAVAGRFLNTGQSCLCAKRFIVHESIAEEFGRRFADAVAELVIGDPTEDGHQDRPARPGRPRREPGTARSRRPSQAGAEVLTGGEPPRPRPGLVRPDRPGRRDPRHAGHGRGDVRPGGRRHRVRHRRRGRRPGQRHALRPRRQRLVGRRANGPSPSAPASTPARCSSTPSPPPTRDCRSAASSSPATAASSARPAPASSPTSAPILVG